MQPLQSILKKFVKDFGLEGGTVLNKIKMKWSKTVGQTIADHTYPDTVRKGTLTVIVDTPQWLHHLSFYKKDILEKLADQKVTDIRFRTGKIPSGGEKEIDPVYKELDEEDKRFIDNTLKGLKDEELKDKFRKLISKGLRNK